MAEQAQAAGKGTLLDIRNLRIEATVYPPGEDPRDVVIVDDVSLTVERGNTVYSLAPEEVSKWEAATKPVTEEWIKEVSSKGVDGKKLYDEAVSLSQGYAK